MNPTTDTHGLSPARRKWLFGAVAASAACAGLGLAWWTGQSASDGASNKPKSAFWDLVFDTPSGEQLATQTFFGKPLILNFWATWCPPCIEEMPLLDRFFSKNNINGWQVLGLAIDQPAAVSAFLRHNPVRFPIALAGLAGADLSRSIGNIGGGLPFTAVFDRGGDVAHRKIGRVTPAELALWQAGL